jgi:hypothetical protein
MESATKNRFAKELASIEQHMGHEGLEVFEEKRNMLIEARMKQMHCKKRNY